MEGMILAALMSTAVFYHCAETKGALECRHASTHVVVRAETPQAVERPADDRSTSALQLADAGAVGDDRQAESHEQCVSAYRNRQYDSMNETWHVDRIRACDESNAKRRPPAMQASKTPQTELSQPLESLAVSISAK